MLEWLTRARCSGDFYAQKNALLSIYYGAYEALSAAESYDQRMKLARAWAGQDAPLARGFAGRTHRSNRDHKLPLRRHPFSGAGEAVRAMT